MQTDELLKKRIAYEKMLASISEQAVMVENLDHFLGSSLKSMGNILDVSRVFIFEYQFSSDTFSCICEWNAKGTTKFEDFNGQIISMPWGMKLLKDGQVINFQDTRDIPGKQLRENWLA